MKYILLDTCVLVNCTLMNIAGADPELLVALVDRIRDQGAKLLLPDVVRLEYARKVPEVLVLISQQTKTFRESVTTSVLPGPDVSRIHATLDKLDSDRDAAAKQAQDYFKQVSRDPAVTVPIALDGDAVAEAVGYVLAGEKPSTGPHHGGLVDPDSLIVASVTLFARSEGFSETDILLICSDNHKDFGQWNPDEGVHELAEDIAARIPCPVRYYKSPRLLLERELETVVKGDESLSDALDEYDRLSDTMSSSTRFCDTLKKLQTMSVPTIDPSVLEGMMRAATIDPSLWESMKRAATIDPSLWESMKRAATIAPSLFENMKRAATIDPSLLEDMKRAYTIAPEIMRRFREITGASETDDTTTDEAVDGNSDELGGPAGPDDTHGDT